MKCGIFQIGIKNHLHLTAYCVLVLAHTSSQDPFTLPILSRLAQQTAKEEMNPQEAVPQDSVRLLSAWDIQTHPSRVAPSAGQPAKLLRQSQVR